MDIHSTIWCQHFPPSKYRAASSCIELHRANNMVVLSLSLEVEREICMADVGCRIDFRDGHQTFSLVVPRVRSQLTYAR